MWTILTGYLLSNVFENQTVKLFKNQFSNKTLSLSGIVIGWLFQEHTKEELDMTGGKRFILERDFRNRFLAQSFKIFRNLLLYPHLITVLELGTFLLLFGLFFIVVTKLYLPKFKVAKQKFINDFLKPTLQRIHFSNYQSSKNYDIFINNFLIYVYLNWSLSFNCATLFSCFFILFKYGFLKIYFWFDLFFIFRPVILIIFLLYTIFSIFWLNYLIYTYFIYCFPKNIALLIKILTKKFIFYFSCLWVFIELLIYDINTQNLVTDNFFKEIFFKIILISAY